MPFAQLCRRVKLIKATFHVVMENSFKHVVIAEIHWLMLWNWKRGTEETGALWVYCHGRNDPLSLAKSWRHSSLRCFLHAPLLDNHCNLPLIATDHPLLMCSLPNAKLPFNFVSCSRS